MRKRILFFFMACSAAFASYAQAPAITSFSPASGQVGTLVTIAGTNLASPSSFTIGGVPAIIVSDDGSQLVGMIMPGAATGSISLSTSGGTATGSSNFTLTTTPYPALQQGNKIVGADAITQPGQGGSVAISADGNTAVTGGSNDSNGIGAIWVYTRTGTSWTQQAKLSGAGGVGTAIYQGDAVALSADGNTLIEGGFGDGGNSTGAAWIFTRSGNTWSQQGAKLIGTGAVSANQGISVSISADGNTAAVGGYTDNFGKGAVWVFSRSGTTWAQQGTKLVGVDASHGSSAQGSSVALSGDGNTLIEGGPNDSTNIGAAWVFTRAGSTWTQQGTKLVGADAVGLAYQGTSVALSADGNTALVGGPSDSGSVGAAFVFTRAGGVWTGQGKLSGTGATGASRQGKVVSLSADGNTAILGGPKDNTSAGAYMGAVWVFTRSGTVWSQQGAKLVGTGYSNYAAQGGSVAVSADGSTLIEGGGADGTTGAVWIFANDPSAGIDGIDGPQADVHLYPNPNKGSFILETSQLQGAGYMIADMLGRTILQQPITSDKQSIDIANVPSGVYTLLISGCASRIKFEVIK